MVNEAYTGRLSGRPLIYAASYLSCRPVGTFRTNRIGLTMSVVQSRPEVTDRGSRRRFGPISDMRHLVLCVFDIGNRRGVSRRRTPLLKLAPSRRSPLRRGILRVGTPYSGEAPGQPWATTRPDTSTLARGESHPDQRSTAEQHVDADQKSNRPFCRSWKPGYDEAREYQIHNPGHEQPAPPLR